MIDILKHIQVKRVKERKNQVLHQRKKRKIKIQNLKRKKELFLKELQKRKKRRNKNCNFRVS